MPTFAAVEVGLLIGAAGLGMLALCGAPRSTVAALFVVALLTKAGAIDSRDLPGSGLLADASAAVSSWQQDRIHAGACYHRGVRALGEGEDERLDAVERDC